ncbi:thiamine-monophosphate kinase [Methylohalomonas lacus]|uniref:Thiamine-monophosphate kinase n=1 Tax=Methylohalomonas lacus TaxID=398773 RepID=A0AAE3HKV5_9GAMM|nr:thiamine-phosphate kinase [Methylohalomonas lacus]MCS3902308.1 thiamine-monophosphate kinase [Methylohalomonas lacus]
MNEFDLIRQYFRRDIDDVAVRVGVGDDAAVLQVPDGYELVVTMDTLVSGVHFAATAAPADIGWKALAVNLSDLAAMGAEPRWITLGLTLPQADSNWLAGFSQGFFDLAEQFSVGLVGGDLTRGPLTITVQAHGLVPAATAITRSGAQCGDLLAVSGYLGDAGYALTGSGAADNDADYFRQRLHRPHPPVAAGMSVRGRVNAAIDISDGLLADSDHLLAASRLGAVIHTDHIPISPQLAAACDRQTALQLALTAGDDYELCLALAAAAEDDVRTALRAVNRELYVLGCLHEGSGVQLEPAVDGLSQSGYAHF